MVVHAFPAFKLGALLVKQISKPIANLVKTQAKSSPVFRRYVCLPPAQFYNWCEVKSKMWLLNLGQPVQITVLNEAASIELGANLLGEGVIFLIAAGILIAEYNRSTNKEAAKEEAKNQEMARLQRDLRELFIQTEEQAAHIRELSRKLGVLDTESPRRAYEPKEPTPSEDPPKQDPPDFAAIIKKKHDIEEIEQEIHPGVGNKCDYSSLQGVIFKGLTNFTYDFGIEAPRKRESSILTTALDHLYQNVYRIPLKM